MKSHTLHTNTKRKWRGGRKRKIVTWNLKKWHFLQSDIQNPCNNWHVPNSNHFVSDSPVWDSLHINNKEALAIGLAAKWWNRLWSDPHIIIYSDNQAAVQMINKGMTAYNLIMQDLAFGNLQFPHHHCLWRGHP